MKNKYSEKSDGEIDRLLAERFGDIVFEYSHEWIQFDGAEFIVDATKSIGPSWNPCDKDSNQLVNYVFPKLREMRQVIEVDYWMNQIKIYPVHRPELLQQYYHWNNIDDINRTIAEACIMAFDKLNEQS